MEVLILIVFQILVVLFSVVIHEVSHGLAANSMGDTTAKNLGRLTLNPFKHLDLFGSVILPLLTIFLTGFVFGYAKPVPYNPNNLDDKKYGPAKVALAGPLSNIVLALGFGLFLRFLPPGLETTLVPQLFSFIILLNLVLALFNLIPIPPLDGHWLVLTFLPDKFYRFKMAFQRYGLLLFILVIFYVFPIILPVVSFFFELIVGAPLII